MSTRPSGSTVAWASERVEFIDAATRNVNVCGSKISQVASGTNGVETTSPPASRTRPSWSSTCAGAAQRAGEDGALGERGDEVLRRAEGLLAVREVPARDEETVQARQKRHAVEEPSGLQQVSQVVELVLRRQDRPLLLGLEAEFVVPVERLARLVTQVLRDPNHVDGEREIPVVGHEAHQRLVERRDHPCPADDVAALGPHLEGGGAHGDGVDRLREDEPLPDDEQAIFEMSASDWMAGVIALIDRYDNAPHVKNTLKQLGYTGVPVGNGEQATKRLEMYRALKGQAAKRDLEEVDKETEKINEALFENKQ